MNTIELLKTYKTLIMNVEMRIKDLCGRHISCTTKKELNFLIVVNSTSQCFDPQLFSVILLTQC